MKKIFSNATFAVFLILILSGCSIITAQNGKVNSGNVNPTTNLSTPNVTIVPSIVPVPKSELAVQVGWEFYKQKINDKVEFTYVYLHVKNLKDLYFELGCFENGIFGDSLNKTKNLPNNTILSICDKGFEKKICLTLENKGQLIAYSFLADSIMGENIFSIGIDENAKIQILKTRFVSESPKGPDELSVDYSLKQIDKMFSMCRKDLFEYLGKDYQTANIGPEGSYLGYYFYKRAISIAFLEDVNNKKLVYISFGEKATIEGAKTNMIFDDIEKRLGKGEHSHYKNDGGEDEYSLRYSRGKYIIQFVSNLRDRKFAFAEYFGK